MMESDFVRALKRCRLVTKQSTGSQTTGGPKNGLANMKKRRYVKVFLVVMVLLLFSYYFLYDKMKSTGDVSRNLSLLLHFAGVKRAEDDLTMTCGRKPEHLEKTHADTGRMSKSKNPFLCDYDIGYKRWPAKALEVPEILPFGTLSSERYFQAALANLKSCDLPKNLKNITCLNCVVVGNGGVLRNKTLGKKIDSYDVVIRLNSGPVIGYEDDVGNKTTFRFSYPESISSDHSQYDPNTILVFVPFKAIDLRWLKEVLSKQKVSMRGFWKKIPVQLMYKSSQIRILKPSIVQKAAFDLLKLPTHVPWPKPPQYPTTGIIAITMALTMCDKVHIAGFKYDVYNPNSTLHYYGSDTMSTMKKMVYHNVTAEQMFLKKLKSSNTIFDLTGEY
ncbi:type 2 lactosamine alpha-2,3-sialyltransferase-like isoform X3 [Scyliorhinus canicula]|uniref:type 2 lactosamine alpha-2,3-sialyltransferase-like isoform X3 n=1 Tax=Scyliorhinus canicula TaxID=7830 RepID=UPI0018F4EC98|nr:type 2 lactosamine alpha-2,3-sialyltransferase-like isoform X3 [Scyliorhinus canicula]